MNDTSGLGFCDDEVESVAEADKKEEVKQNVVCISETDLHEKSQDAEDDDDDDLAENPPAGGQTFL